MGKLSSNISSIYQYKPAFKNLYRIDILPGNQENFTESINNYANLHAISISFNGETLNLERNNVTKLFSVNGNGESFSRVDTLTITWREDENWTVKKYHDNWLDCFYNKEKDYWISYPVNSLLVQGRSDTLNSNNNISMLDLNRTFLLYLPNSRGVYTNHIRFIGVLPSNTGNIDLSWGNSGEVVSYTINYNVRDWKWEVTQY